MSSNITFEQIDDSSPLPNCSSCKDSGVCIELDGMPRRRIFHPEDWDNNSRADCAIFFSDGESTGSHHRGGRFVSIGSDDDSSDELNHVSIVELKSTYEDAKNVEEQIEGAIEFVRHVLSNCSEPPWGLEWYCLVPHDTGYKNRAQARVSKNIGGSLCIFNAVPVNNGESLRDIIQRDIYSTEI